MTSTASKAENFQVLLFCLGSAVCWVQDWWQARLSVDSLYCDVIPENILLKWQSSRDQEHKVSELGYGAQKE